MKDLTSLVEAGLVDAELVVGVNIVTDDGPQTIMIFDERAVNERLVELWQQTDDKEVIREVMIAHTQRRGCMYSMDVGVEMVAAITSMADKDCCVCGQLATYNDTLGHGFCTTHSLSWAQYVEQHADEEAFFIFADWLRSAKDEYGVYLVQNMYNLGSKSDNPHI